VVEVENDRRQGHGDRRDGGNRLVIEGRGREDLRIAGPVEGMIVAADGRRDAAVGVELLGDERQLQERRPVAERQRRDELLAAGQEPVAVIREMRRRVVRGERRARHRERLRQVEIHVEVEARELLRVPPAGDHVSRPGDEPGEVRARRGAHRPVAGMAEGEASPRQVLARRRVTRRRRAAVPERVRTEIPSRGIGVEQVEVRRGRSAGEVVAGRVVHSGGRVAGLVAGRHQLVCLEDRQRHDREVIDRLGVPRRSGEIVPRDGQDGLGPFGGEGERQRRIDRAPEKDREDAGYGLLELVLGLRGGRASERQHEGQAGGAKECLAGVHGRVEKYALAHRASRLSRGSPGLPFCGIDAFSPRVLIFAFRFGDSGLRAGRARPVGRPRRPRASPVLHED
jgi:hypothetical protein